MHSISKKIVECFRRGHFLYACGNGGSAAMADEMVGEMVCTFENKNRKGLPAISLNSNVPVITAWSNDFVYETCFARQIEAYGKPGDVLISFSTSGKSKSCLNAMVESTKKGMIVIEFPHKGSSTAPIQESQHKLMHRVCREVEREMFSK